MASSGRRPEDADRQKDRGMPTDDQRRILGRGGV